ncbi:TIGR00341 family protein [Halorubrum sp. Ib24]|uniref:DUF389 domain-containing protein n=1 Tax=unclassified Halorubrum TaxID=2642239 RepID=UPI000B988685|nr:MULTISPECIES: DUF389 domain-containing protein [unclassified Halorubrum]OYR41692.1 TIGR00341 family protein [Halorubrum sp. Ib24]OYR46241.1 TIGR00341 family protein [Halorubrum sp. Eb13]OYR48650.1 TIGR00341 family protein [Halorubrum sp. Ea8]
MRLVQVFVPKDDRDAVREALSEMEVEFVFTDANGGREGSLAEIPVPSGAVGVVLDRLYEAGLDEDTYTVVTDVEEATVPNADELEDRYVEGPKGKRGAPNVEIRARAEDLTPDTATYLAFAVASAVVAVGGLLLDSAIVIVGAMVIAPFAGSTLSASVGAVISDHEMVVDSATSQVTGLVVAYLGAVAMSVFLQRSGFVPSTLDVATIGQVGAFVTPNLLTFAIAVSAGFAGALAIATDLPVSIAGVAVAAAIVPAAAVAGIGTAWGQPLVVAGGTVLLLMNIVFINLTAYLTLVALGYRSSVIPAVRESADVSLRSGAYAVIVLLFVVVVAVTALGTYQHLVFEQEANDGVQTVLDGEEYSELELAGVATEYNDAGAFSDEVSVTVTVGRSGDSEHERLATDLQAEIDNRTARSVRVDVRFVDYQRAPATGDGERGVRWPFDEWRPSLDEWIPTSARTSVA